MDKNFWNARYENPAYAYGTIPNEYFKTELDKIPAGKILLPAEGEGRNAVYAAQSGWEVFAFDQSEEGQKKAYQLAEANKVNINYQVGFFDALNFPNEQFDCIALIYAHLPDQKRRQNHRDLLKLLKKGGHLILEGFSVAHKFFQEKNPYAGGPKDHLMLYSPEELLEDFKELNNIEVKETETELSEGMYHQGKASVIRILGRK